jgi:cyanophycin synthetase
MNLIEPIHEHAKTRPDAPAIITPQRNISWSELDSLIWSTALKLSEYGLKSGDRVGIAMAHPVIHLVIALALARMGVAHIAIAASESGQVRNELSTKLELKALISDLENIVKTTSNAVLLNKLVVRNINSGQKESLRSIDGSLTWLISQSSGTTGKPKYFSISHNENFFRMTLYLPVLGCNEKDIFWTASRLDFVSAKQRVISALHRGAAVCLPSNYGVTIETVNFVKCSNVTLAFAIPSHIHQILLLNCSLPNIRAFQTGTTTISERLRTEFRKRVCPNLYITYGTNEIGPATTVGSDWLDTLPNTVGFPIGSIEIEIVNDSGIRLPPLETGEIRIKNTKIDVTYINDTEATAKSFKEGWFYPGDLGYLTKEGALILQGRKDDMMIFDGMNIYPAEIENILSSHPAVKEVAAFALKHERFQDVPVAAVTLKEPIAERDLIEFCKTSLGIKHPKRIFIFKEFPRNQIGKILKRELSAIVAKMCI